MDVRWLAYIGSGVLATASLVPMTWESATAPTGVAPAAARPSALRPRAARDDYATLMEIERRLSILRDYQTNAPAPRAAARNPFRFGSRATRQAPEVTRAATPVAVEPPPDPVVPAPTLRLVGVVERRHDDVSAFTAVLAAFGNVHLVVAGSRLGDRYEVRAVSADQAEVYDEQTREVITLALSARR